MSFHYKMTGDRDGWKNSRKKRSLYSAMNVLRAMGKDYSVDALSDFVKYGPQSLFWYN